MCLIWPTTQDNAIQNGCAKAVTHRRGGSTATRGRLHYVKADLGMAMKGNLGPDGRLLPDPDVLLSYTAASRS